MRSCELCYSEGFCYEERGDGVYALPSCADGVGFTNTLVEPTQRSSLLVAVAETSANLPAAFQLAWRTAGVIILC